MVGPGLGASGPWLALACVPLGPGWAVERPAVGRLRSFHSLPHCDGQQAVGIFLLSGALPEGRGHLGSYMNSGPCAGAHWGLIELVAPVRRHTGASLNSGPEH